MTFMPLLLMSFMFVRASALGVLTLFLSYASKSPRPGTELVESNWKDEQLCVTESPSYS